MSNKLSHSSANRFMECPKSWEYHYIQKLRPSTQSSGLSFGSAIDSAFTALLRGSDKPAERLFLDAWTFQEINKVNTFLPTATNLAYSNSDFDHELLLESDLQEIRQKFNIEDVLQEYKTVSDLKDIVGYKNLQEDKKVYFNYCNWLCLKRKGLLMIKAFKEDVLPEIEEVLGVQVLVELKNELGDTIIGYADLVAKIRGYSAPIIIDFKTSSKKYEADSVLTSPQLTLYVHALSQKFEQTRLAGFWVFYKLVEKNKTKVCSKCNVDGTGKKHKTCDNEIQGKRCHGDWIVSIDPKIRTEKIIDEIPVQTETIILENLDHINIAIKSKNFYRNLGSCIKGWGKCQYYDLCYKNSDDGLIKQ